MQTTDLIERLATDLRPARSRTRLLAIATLMGAAVALGLLLLLLGFRSDLARAVFSTAFWMKWGLALATGAVAFLLCVRLARPESKPGSLPLFLLLPILVLGVAACMQLVGATHTERWTMWLGHSAVQCFWCIPLLAIPLLVGVLWAFRFFAPTRLRLAGFSAGLLAGAVAAGIYALSCGETSAAFVATWYSAGMLFPALIGLLIGPRVLRW
jgi:hypothetical protein